jgi:hypothetical protein
VLDRLGTRPTGSSVRFWPLRCTATNESSSETEMTGASICLATRSAVRWRVPVSLVEIPGSGTRCTLARAIRVQSDDRIIAPSILASSESRCGVNSASSRNPPEHNESTSGPSPITMSAPILACRIRSSPSRSGRPGATNRSAESIASDRAATATVWSSGSVRGSAGHARRIRRSRDGADTIPAAPSTILGPKVPISAGGATIWSALM